MLTYALKTYVKNAKSGIYVLEMMQFYFSKDWYLIFLIKYFLFKEFLTCAMKAHVSMPLFL